MKTSTILLTFLSLVFFTSCTENNEKNKAEENIETGTQHSKSHLTDTLPNSDHKHDIDEESLENENSDIAEIRSEYLSIREQIDTEKLTKQEEEFTCTREDNHGRLVRYLDGEKVIMVEHVSGIGHAFSTKRYYFKDGELFFVFVKETSWGFGGPVQDGQSGTIDKIHETRYYIHSGEIIRQLEKSFEIRSWMDDPTSEEIPNKEVAVKQGQTWPNMQKVDELKAGNIDC